MELIDRNVTIDSRIVAGDTYSAGDIRVLTFHLV
jgi:hypothetical protein